MGGDGLGIDALLSGQCPHGLQKIVGLLIHVSQIVS